MRIRRRQRPSRYELTHGMSGLFRKVSRRAKISGLRGWVGRIRTSDVDSRNRAAKEFTREFGATSERLGSRDFAAFLGANAEVWTSQTLSAGPGGIEPVFSNRPFR